MELLKGEQAVQPLRMATAAAMSVYAIVQPG